MGASFSEKIMDRLDNLGYKHRGLAKMLAAVEYHVFQHNKTVSGKMQNVLQQYAKDRLNDSRSIRRLKKDMLFSRMHYRVTFLQYFLFGFERLSDTGRKEFVGDYDKIRVTDQLHQSSDLYQKFRNKYKAYEIFRPYYQRSIVEIRNDEDRAAFLEFARQNPRFMLKSENESKGNGTRVADPEKEGITAEEMFEQLRADGGVFVAEELIKQSAQLSRIHPDSVNTVRFVTYLKPDHVLHMFSFLRMGSGGACIDNASAGGISAGIDMETGIVTTRGFKEDLTTYLTHPDTGVQIIGMQLPDWAQLLETVDALARVVPEQKYVGWDLAHTDHGWVMVEGNDSAMMTATQMCERRGIRKVFNEAFYPEKNEKG